MFTWNNENPECKSLHVSGLDVGVATSHKEADCLATSALSKNGVQTIELTLNGIGLDDEKTRVGFAVQGWQKRNNFKSVLGSSNDSWALSSGGFFHDNKSFAGPGFPQFQPNHAQIHITLDYEENKAEFWLDGQNVNIIRKLPKKVYQVYVYLQNGSVLMKLTHICKNWRPPTLRFKEHSNKEIMLRYERLLNEIHQSKQHKIKTNILLISEPGVGKTSFMNTLMTATAKDRHQLQDVIPYGSVRDISYRLEDDEKSELHSHTRKITCYRLPQSQIYVWDTFGMTTQGQTRYINDFASIMEGKLRPGYDKSISGVDQPDCVIPSKRLKPEDRIHCVLVLIDGEKLMENDDQIFDAPREFIDSAQHLHDDGLRTLVLLTKVDIIGKNQFIDGVREERFNIKNVYKNPIIYEKARLIKKKLGVGLNQIIPICSYSSSEETQGLNYGIEIFHLRSITLAMKLASIVQDKLMGTKDIDSDSETDSSDDSDDDNTTQ